MTLDIFAGKPTRAKGRSRRITAGRLTEQKPALKTEEVWSIRARLEPKHKLRDLALFNLAIDSQLRGGDLVRVKAEEVAAWGAIKPRAAIVQKKTARPVQFEIAEQTRRTPGDLIRRHGRCSKASAVTPAAPATP